MSTESTYLTIVSLMTGTLVAVFVGFYVPLVRALFRWYSRDTWRRIIVTRRRAPLRQRLVATSDAIVASIVWATAFLCLAPLLLVVVPTGATLAAFTFSVHAIRVGGG
jgi:hypothetical protein